MINDSMPGSLPGKKAEAVETTAKLITLRNAAQAKPAMPQPMLDRLW
jgi:hypothetical protein